MERRAFLIGVGALVSASGCVSGEGETADVPESVTVDDGKVEVSFNSLVTGDTIEYYDPETDTVEALEPENKMWAEALLFVDYNGGGEIPTDSADNFTAEVGGSVYRPVDELPVDEDQLRDDDFHYPVDFEAYHGESIGSKGETPFRFLFDVPDGDVEFYWEYDETKYQLSPIL